MSINMKLLIGITFLAAAVFIFAPRTAQADHLINNVYTSPYSAKWGDAIILGVTVQRDADDCKVIREYSYIQQRSQDLNANIPLTTSGIYKVGSVWLGYKYETTGFTVKCWNRRARWWDHTDEASTVAKIAPVVNVRVNGQSSVVLEGNESLTIEWWSTSNARTCYVTDPVTYERLLENLSGSFTKLPGDPWYPQSGAGGSRYYSFECSEYRSGQAQPPGGWGVGSGTASARLRALPPTVNFTVNGTAGNITIQSNQNLTLAWNVDGNGWNLHGCNISGGYSTSFGSYGDKTLSDSITFGPADQGHPNPPPGDSYTLTCTSDAGTTSVTRRVDVSTPPLVPEVDIKANDSDGPITITAGQSANLTWTSKNATSCRGYSNPTCYPNWCGDNKSLNNASGESVRPTANTTFILSCTGERDTTDDSVTVNVVNPEPRARLFVNNQEANITIRTNQDLTLRWESSDATSCAFSSPFSETVAVSGSRIYRPGDTYHPNPSGKTYTISCSGLGGQSPSVSRRVDVVGSPGVDLKTKKTTDPDSAYTGGPLTVNQGQLINLRWTSSNASSCSSNWRNPLANNGTDTSDPSLAGGGGYTYEITCAGFAGWSSATDSVRVNVLRQKTLSVTSSPVDGVSISSATGHSGTTNYSRTVSQGTAVSLTAPSTHGGYNFTSWSGCDSVSGTTCSLTVNLDRSVTANFSAISRTLSVNSSGASGVSITSATGHSGTTNYSRTVSQGTAVSLTAPSTQGGYNFTSWSGCDSVSGTTCSLTVNSDRTVTANYSLTQRNLSVTKTGNGSGLVVSSPSGINCGPTCSTNFDYGTTVTLTASPAAGSTFTGWSGEGCSGTGTCNVSMTQNRSVTADFSLTQRNLSVTKTGTGSGLVVSSPSGINCGPTCSTNFDYGTTVTLTASPAPGSSFTGWSGEGCSGTGTCNVSMTQNRSVTANFSALNQPPSAINLSVSQPDYCQSGPTGFYSWQFQDPDPGDSQSAYRAQVDNNSDFSSPEDDSGKVMSSSQNYATPLGKLSYNTTYYWRLMVWDQQDADSGWISGPSFTTPSHAYPAVDFTWTPLNPAVNEETRFTDQSSVFGGSTKSSWFWTFQDGAPSSSSQQNPVTAFNSSGAKTVTLRVTDSDGFACQTSKTVNAKLVLPEWKEIAPF